MEKTIACIDVGTTKVCTLVGEINELGVLRIIGVGISPSQGLRKGIVVNATEAADAIAASVERAERIPQRKDRVHGTILGHVNLLIVSPVAAVRIGEQIGADCTVIQGRVEDRPVIR